MAEYESRRDANVDDALADSDIVSACVTDVGLSYSEDEVLRVGQHVMVFSAHVGGVLSVCPEESVASVGCALSASTLTKAPVARNVFVIAPVRRRGFEVPKEGDALHYGEPFRLVSNPLLPVDEPMYVHSEPRTPFSKSKFSEKQLVAMSYAGNSTDTVWRCEAADPRLRFELEGSPVPANAPLIVVHNATNACLAAQKKYPYFTDFGNEFEVCVHTFLSSKGKRATFAKESEGDSDVAPAELEENHFAFLTAASPEMEEPLHIQRKAREAREAAAQDEEAA